MANKLYTKTGDQGKTSLFGGQRVLKYNQRVQTYGEVDELNSILGIIRTVAEKEEKTDLYSLIAKIQNQLFNIGSELATPDSAKSKAFTLTSDKEVELLEKEIDQAVAHLPKLKNFILPGGTLINSYLHLARTVCRRAERKVVFLAEKEELNEFLIIYLNRLSDLLFALARLDSFLSKAKEYEWEKS